MKPLTWKFADRTGWPSGEWDYEPDKEQWQDESTGLPCLAVRSRLGNWCGYVGVSPGHPLHGKGYSDTEADDLDCHGGLTFAGGCTGDEHGICHVVEPGEPDEVWWLGFDCAHAWDYAPRKPFGSPVLDARDWDQTYKNLAYVRRQCANLASQLAAVVAGTVPHHERAAQGIGELGVIALLGVLLLAGPAHAWRTGIGAEGGLLNGDPATSVLMDLNAGPMSRWHIQPHLGWWKPDGREGTFGAGLDVTAHLKPCHATSPYLGVGVGGEWRGNQGPARPCDCALPPPRHDPPPPRDPPTGTVRAGLRFLPSGTVDLFAEARAVVSPGAEPRYGPFLGVVLHEPRKVAGAKKAHRHRASRR